MLDRFIYIILRWRYVDPWNEPKKLHWGRLNYNSTTVHSSSTFGP
jgi:hypothetical protein